MDGKFKYSVIKLDTQIYIRRGAIYHSDAAKGKHASFIRGFLMRAWTKNQIYSPLYKLYIYYILNFLVYLLQFVLILPVNVKYAKCTLNPQDFSLFQTLALKSVITRNIMFTI